MLPRRTQPRGNQSSGVSAVPADLDEEVQLRRRLPALLQDFLNEHAAVPYAVGQVYAFWCQNGTQRTLEALVLDQAQQTRRFYGPTYPGSI